jgi:hypothetical protein
MTFFRKTLVACLCLAAFDSIQLSAMEFVKMRTTTIERLSLHINGLSYHFEGDRDELNEFNYGLGFSYYMGEIQSESWFLNDFKVFIEADVYSDSFSDLGYLFGASVQRRLWKQIDWGVNLGLIHEDNLKEKSDLYLHPFAFPYVQTNFDLPFNARILYVPPVHNGGIIALQMLLSF